MTMHICDNWDCDCNCCPGRHQYDDELFDKCPECGAKKKGASAEDLVNAAGCAKTIIGFLLIFSFIGVFLLLAF